MIQGQLRVHLESLLELTSQSVRRGGGSSLRDGCWNSGRSQIHR